jgi:FAD-linked oxidoreductase
MPATWRNWSGSVACAPAGVDQPRDEEAIVALVRACRARGHSMRVVGAGHSFTPLVATEGRLVSLAGWQGVESVDALAGLATVRGGTWLHQLGAELHQHGLAQENLGDIDRQSIAGAISTGTHGTGIALGGIATQVAGLRLVTASGEIVECSEERDAATFRAARVALGALGVISAVTLRVVPAYRLHYTWQREALNTVLAGLAGERERNRNFEFYWFPHTDAALVKRTNLTDAPAGSRRLMRELNDLALENGAFWLLSELCRRRPSLSPAVARLSAAAVSSGSVVDDSHRVYATRRLVRFQEMEYSIPADALPGALDELRRMVARERIDVHFPVECRFVRGDDIPLSTAYGRDSAYIAVHMYRGMPYQRYFGLAEAIFRRYAGRPHWGKLHTLAAAELRPLYPEWERFQETRRALDPQGMFLNRYLRMLFEVS